MRCLQAMEESAVSAVSKEGHDFVDYQFKRGFSLLFVSLTERRRNGDLDGKTD